MPTIVREQGFEITIRTRDHDPAHVHVLKAGADVNVRLDDLEVVKIEGSISLRDVRRAVDIVETHRERLLQAWGEIHGN